MADFKPTRTRTVGFVGGAGTGKSSVLNSLLDVEDLVKSGNSGGACTCAATEFHYHESDTLSIQVQLFDEDELLSQQMCLLESYRHFHFAYVLNANDSDAAERSHFKKRAKLAKDTFYSLFHTRTPCHDTLLHADKGEVECIFRRLIRELRPVSSQTNMTNLTKSACAEKLLELSSAPASAAESATRAAAWPYIEKIKVFLNAQILKKGLVLVDLPGLRDINSARRNITELYDIQAKESQKDWPGERADFIGEKLAAIAECEADIEELDEELETLPEKEDRLREDDRKASDLNDRKRRVELLRFLVQTRNGDIVTQLSTAYRAANTNTATNVFCVSNTLYSKRRNARLSAALPFLQLSGIIELRRHCISIVSANQHREASVFVKTDVPKLLADIGLWAQSGVDTLDGERRAAVKVVLDNVENRLQSNLFGRRAPTQELSRALCQIFRTEIYDMRLVSQWSTSARAAAYEWRSWHHMTYSAYCRNYGNHSTAKARDRNWNDEAIRHMVRDMTTPWSTVESRLQEEYARVSEFFRDSLDSAIHPLYDDDDDNNPIQWAATLEPLRRAMLLEKFVLLDALENAFEKASLQLKQLKIDGLTSWRTSYTGVYMEGPYNTAMHDSGTGSDGRRKSTITGAFGSEDLFDDIMTKLRAGFGTLAAAAQADVTAAVNAHLAQVGATLDLVRDGNAVIEAQRDLAFHGRVSEALRAGQDKMRDIVGRLEA
ncbi:tat pathway signal sequence [Cordyceps javanica]|uniref:Tat pathway signal sequence n=1 Tax=Cordyceps javanica TaxID=43265 RepID=A0A545V1K0_9HYPO|nr:tat pathway signal sequence [Cordyceps javanica]TQW07213.1 tat pathway signal sequence [Cordyceps javanica]